MLQSLFRDICEVKKKIDSSFAMIERIIKSKP